MDDLSETLLGLPVLGIACVIDRPGYNARYQPKYGENRWMLCKTAFAIAVERAVKYSLGRDRKMRLYVEQSGKSEDRKVKGYYETIRKDGPWFDGAGSSRYSPLDATAYQSCLYDFKRKTKESLLMTIADLYLWPMCIGGYHPGNKSYAALKEAGKLIDCHLSQDALEEMGIKYSCFEGVQIKTAT